MDSYPELPMGREGGFEPSRLRMDGRRTTVVGAVIDGEEAYFDNGILVGKGKVEEGVTFGPEVLRAMGGRRVLALWFAATTHESGKPGWHGLTVGEMRIDAAKKDGFRDVNAFQNKLTDAARGRTAVWQMKEEERGVLAKLLASKPGLWKHASRSFRDTVLATLPSLSSLDTAADDDGVPADAGAPSVDLGSGTGVPARTLRSGGRDVTIVGLLLDRGRAEWDNRVLVGKSPVEEGVDFGPEPLRAMGGARSCLVWVAVARREDGTPGFHGVTVSEMRIDAAKKQGYRDVVAYGTKVNEAARGRVEIGRLKPEERAALETLLKAEEGLWQAAVENIRFAFG